MNKESHENDDREIINMTDKWSSMICVKFMNLLSMLTVVEISSEQV